MQIKDSYKLDYYKYLNIEKENAIKDCKLIPPPLLYSYKRTPNKINKPLRGYLHRKNHSVWIPLYKLQKKERKIA